MSKRWAIALGILLIVGVVMVSGCTSDDTSDTYTPNTGSSSSSGDYQVTAGTTSDGYGYAYDTEGNVAVSDGQDTYGVDKEGNVYKYN